MAARPGLGTMIGRALLLRCPWCGSRRTFLRGWLRKYDRCRSCGIAWRREEGFELGAMTLNTIATFVVVVVVMGVWMVLTAPEIPVLPMVLGVGVLAVAAPLCFFPFSFTLWLVFDLVARPPEADELAAARAAVDATTGNA